MAVLSPGSGGGLPPPPAATPPAGDTLTATMSATGATVKLGNVTVTVPPGAMPLGAKVTLSPAALPPLPPEWTATGPAFKVTTTAATTKPLQVKLGPSLTASDIVPGPGGWYDTEDPTTHIFVIPLAMASSAGQIAPSSTPLNVTVVPVKANVAPLTVTVGASAAKAKPGVAVGYTAEAKGGTPPYTFDVFADGALVGHASAGQVTFTTEGPRTIAVTVTDKNGKQARASTIVDVASDPITITLAGPATLAHGTSATYTATISGRPLAVLPPRSSWRGTVCRPTSPSLRRRRGRTVSSSTSR